MTLGSEIAKYRKEKGLTQEALAQTLGVTNQAVSKWESDQCCPDVMLLPKLSDLFGISLDALFGREFPAARLPVAAGVPAVAGQTPVLVKGLPWPDDRTLRVVIYQGHVLLENTPDLRNVTFRYEGEALNIDSRISICCGEVRGNVDAGTSVSCGNIGGDADAGTYLSCGNIEGSVDAGTAVNCGNVGGNVDAGTNVKCGNVGGDVDAGCNVECQEVHGDVDAGMKVIIRGK